MKKIHNIIQSELVVRTNNVKFRQEFGELGVSANLRNEGNTTIFTTEFGIDKVVSLTVNGINLIEGVHFFVDSEFEIHISNSGDPLNAFSGQRVDVLVVYMRNNNQFGFMTSNLAPVITTFYLNRYSGRNDKIIFNFAIEPRDGKNIYWSILKDGGDTPIYSGSGLATNNGLIVDSSGNLTELSYFVSNEEYLERIGETIPFTLVVVYDLTSDGTVLDEKLLANVGYELLEFQPISGAIVSLPEFIGTPGTYNIDVNYSILNPGGDSYRWQVTMVSGSSPEVILDSGTSTLDISGHVADVITGAEGNFFHTRYYLKVESQVDSSFVQLATDRTTVNIPAQTIDAVAGYLDEAIMNYYDTGLGAWVKIGGLGTAQDVIEYNNRVIRDIFTQGVPITMIDSGVYISAPVYNPSGSIAKVHFIIEIPQTWGVVKFYQPTGEVPLSAFNIIDLGNGFDAYLYAEASSSSTNASDYTLKR